MARTEWDVFGNIRQGDYKAFQIPSDKMLPSYTSTADNLHSAHV